MPEGRDIWGRVTRKQNGGGLSQGMALVLFHTLASSSHCSLDLSSVIFPEHRVGHATPSHKLLIHPLPFRMLFTLLCVTLKIHLVIVPNLRISWSLSVKSTFWSLLQAECLRVPRGAPQFQDLISIHTWHRIQAGRPLKCQDPLRPGPWPPVSMGLGECSQRAPMVPESSAKSVLTTEPLLVIVGGEHPLLPTLHQPSRHSVRNHFPL